MAYPSDYGCAVCSEESAPVEDNPLVFCDGCNVCVHKACYGILSIPTGDWFCSKCAFQRAKSNGQAGETPKAATDSDAQKSPPAVSCQLCPSKEGALKQTRDGKWAHVVCALYIKEASFQNTDLMEPIILSEIPKHRFQQTCYICVEDGHQAESTTGACSICEKGACKKAFHVTCAQKKGFLCEIFKKNKPEQVIYAGFCADHIPPGEHGIVDGARYRKIPAYPRAPSSNGAPERASSSSGYSTPNTTDKSSSPLTGQVSVENVQNSVQAVSTETDTNQRSSSIKSNASVGSNGTTESADSGILTSSDPERLTGSQNSATTTSATNEPVVKNERVIRKPPKKSLAARMDGAGIPVQSPSSSSQGSPQVSSQPSTTVPVPSPQQQQQPTPPQMTVQSPSQPPPPSSASLVPPSLPPHAAYQQYAMMPMSMAPLQQSPGDPPRYYHADNPFATPHDMAYQVNKPVGVVSMESMSQNRSPSMMQPKNGVNQPTDRPTPPLRKRPLSPSILDNETLTISSLIERTIERATTSTTTVPPVSVPYTTGVRPMFPGEENPKPNEGSATKKGKRQPKEPKNDPRRQGTTATIKDILASNGGGMSPQQSPQMQPVQGGLQQQPPHYASPQPEPANASHGKDANKPRSQPPSFVGSAMMADERTNHSADSPFNRERPLTPRTLAARHESNDRHKNAMEKVQHYLNNGIPTSDVVPGSPLSISTAQQTKSNKKNQEEKASRSSYGQGRPGGSQQAPDGRSHPHTASREEPATARKVNGYPNGLVSAESSAVQPEDDVETPAGAMAFDHYMYQLATYGTTAAHNAAVNAHPSAAVTLDGFFRMQKELTSLKQKVGELESLKAFYLTQVQSLRSLSEKYAADGPVSQPTMPEEVARLIGMLGPSDGPEEPSAPTRTKTEVPSDGLMARLHEPGQSSSRGRSDSRVSNNALPPSSVPHHVQQSPSSTPKPLSRSARAVREEKDKNERDSREYVNGGGNSGGYAGGSGGGGGTSSGGNVRRPHYEHLDGLPSGVVSTPAQVATTQAMLMPNMNGQPFLFQNPMYSMAMDPRLFGMMAPGQMGQMQAFLPQTVYAQNMTGYTPVNASDYAGLGRMHTPTSSRYTMEENGGSTGGSSHGQHQSNMKRDYEMPRES